MNVFKCLPITFKPFLLPTLALLFLSASFLVYTQTIQAAPTPPNVSAIAPTSGSSEGGYQYTISGNNFYTETMSTSSISAGLSHSCSISEGSLYCWGANSSGQLGDGTTTQRTAPVKVEGLLAGKTVTKVSAGHEYTCAVANGEAYCWGKNTWWQLGDNTTANRSSPVKVLGQIEGNTVSDISTGFAHTCAVTTNNSAAYCWGYNDFGRLGDGTTTHRASSVKLEGTLSGKAVTSISVGFYYGCAVADNEAYCWGSGTGGALGDGTGAQRTSPTKVTGEITGKVVTKITADTNHTCAIADSRAYCWGTNTNGQLGTGTTATTSSSVQVLGDLASLTVSDISNGINHSCAVADSQTYCWGANSFGQLGDSTTTTRTLPTKIAGFTASSVASVISATENTTCAVINSSSYCWGAGGSYQLGDGSAVNRSSPVSASIKTAGSLQVSFGGTPAIISSSSDTQITGYTPPHAPGPVDVVITKDGGQMSTLAAGYTYTGSGQTSQATITGIAPPSGSTIGNENITISGTNFFDSSTTLSQITAGTSHSCAIDNGSLYCWGSNSYGQLGDGTTAPKLTPIKIEGALAGKTVTSVDAGDLHTCAVADQEAYCWGYNAFGQVGDNSGTTRTSPVKVQGLLAGKTVTQISASTFHTCAVADQEAYCWGYNNMGQIGDGTATQRLTPTKTTTTLMSGLVSKISAGVDHSCAIAAGETFCWGHNAYGQLGNASAANSSVPVKAGGPLLGKTVTDVSASAYYHTCAIADSQMYCWGFNGASQFGDGTTAGKTTPTLMTIPGNGTVTAIGTGYNMTCGTSSLGTYCTGWNNYGKLGDGTTTNRTTFVRVPGALIANVPTTIDSQSNHTCAVAQGKGYCWGYNSSGQLGNSTATDSSYAVRVALSGPSDLNLTLGSTNATITSATDTTITAKTPAHAAGVVDVAISKANGQIATLASGFTYIAPPIVSSITPSTGPTFGGDTVTISGSDFTSGSSVTFGSTPATSTTFINSSTLQVVVPASAQAGTTNVTVTNSPGYAYTLTNGYTYTTYPPFITSVDPSVSKSGGGTTIKITGNYFSNSGINPGSGQFGVKINGKAATSVTYVNSTELSVVTPSNFTGIYDLQVTNYDGQSATLNNAIQYVPDAYAFTNAPLSVHAGEPDTLTIQARDQFGSPITSPFDIELALSSSSEDGKFAVNMNEDESTRWSHTSVIIPAGQTSVNVYYRDTKKGTPTITASGPAQTSVSQNATVISAHKFKVTGITDPVASGIPSSVTITAEDYLGNANPSYVGTVSFSSTDSAAILPNDFTFTSEMNGVYTFVNGVTMVTPGKWCVSATDTTDADTNGTQCNIDVSPAASGTISKLSVITPPQSFPSDSSSSAITVQTQDVNGQAIPVQSDTAIYIYKSSATGSFSQDGLTAWSTDSPFVATIKAGSSTANFFYRDSNVGGFTLTLRDDAGSGQDFGWTNTSQTITTGVGAAAKINVIQPERPAAIDQSAMLTIGLRDSADREVTARENKTLYLTSNSANGTFSLTPNATGTTSLQVTIPAGSNYIQVYYTSTAAGSFDVVVSDGTPPNGNSGLADASATLAFTEDAKLLFTSQSTTNVGEIIPITINSEHRNSSDPLLLQNDTEIRLASSEGGEFSLTQNPWTPVSSVIIPAGQSSASLFFRTSKAGATQITANEYPNRDWLGATKDIISWPGDFYKFGYTSAPSNAAVTEASSDFTVSTQDIYGNVVPVSVDTPAYVHSNSDSGTFASSQSGPWNLTNVVVPAGGTTAKFNYKDTKVGERTITSSDSTTLTETDTGVIDATTSILIGGQTLHNLQITSPAQTITAGDFSGIITIETRKEDGSPARVGTDTVVSLNENSRYIDEKFTLTPNDTAPYISSVTIPAGEYRASFYYTNVKAGVPAFGVKIGQFTATQYITVQPDEPTSLTVATPPQDIYQNQESDQIKLTIQDQYGNLSPLDNDTAITLDSTCESGRFSVSKGVDWQSITELTIPSGGSDAFLYYRDGLSGSCKLTFKGNGLPEASQIINIQASAARLGFSFAPTILELNQESNDIAVSLYDEFGNVTFEQNNRTVYLYSSSNDGRFTPSDVITIPAGQSSANFRYRATSVGSSTVIASDTQLAGGEDTGLQNATTDISIVAGQADKITISPDTMNMRLNEKGRFSVGLQNRYGAEITAASDQTLYLSSNKVNGAFALSSSDNDSSITQVTIPAGSSSVDFYYRQSGNVAEETLITVSDTPPPLTQTDLGLKNANASIKFIPDEAMKLHFATQTQTLLKGQTSAQIQVIVQDQYGNAVPMPNGLIVYLSSTSPQGQFIPGATITIPVGSASTSFTYQDSNTGLHTLMASDRATTEQGSSLVDATQTITVNKGAATSVGFASPISNIERGGISEASEIILRNAYGAEITAESDFEIKLSSSSPSGQFAISPNGPWTSDISLVIAAGQSRDTFYYRDDLRLGSSTITATHVIDAQNNSQINSATTTATVIQGEAVQFTYTTSAQTMSTNRASQVLRIESQNRYGKAAGVKGDTTVYFSSSSQGGQFATSLTDGNWTRSSAVMKKGESNTNFYYRDSVAGTPTITLSDNMPANPDIGLINAQQQQIIRGAATGEFDHFLVTNISDPQSQGNPSSVVVIAMDASNNVVENYEGTINFSSSDPSAILPGSYTFKPMIDRGMHTFTNAVAFTSPGEKTVMVTDQSGKTGSQTAITVMGVVEGDIEQLQFIQPDSPVVLNETSLTSEAITLQSQSSDGRPINAPAGGLIVRLQASSATGEFARSPDGPWQRTAQYTIPEGLNWINLYYRDQAGAGGTLTAQDWTNDSAITDATIAVQLLESDSDLPPDEQPPVVVTPTPTTPNPPAASDDTSDDEAALSGENGSSTNNQPDTTTPGTNAQKPTNSDEANSNRDRTGSKSSTAESLSTALSEKIQTALASAAAPIAIPGVLYLLLLLLAAALLRQIYSEMSRAHFILGALKREQKTAEDKQTFLMLCAHYLRTPVTTISNSIDLLKSQGTSVPQQTLAILTASAASLKNKTEAILSKSEKNAELSEISEPNIAVAEQSIFRSPIFWLPVSATILLTSLGNWAIEAIGHQTLSGYTLLAQVIAGTIVVVLLYGALRSRVIKQEKRRILQKNLEHRASLDQAKNQFITETYENLAHDTSQLLLSLKDLDSSSPAQKILRNGVITIGKVVAKFEVASRIESTATHPSDFTVRSILNEVEAKFANALQNKQIKIHESVDTITLHQDAYLLSQALTVAIEVNPSNTELDIQVHAKDDGMVSITITDNGPGYDQPSEELFQAFNKSKEDVLNMEHGGLGVSMYLQNLIVTHLGGTLTAENSKEHGGAVLTIKIPISAKE